MFLYQDGKWHIGGVAFAVPEGFGLCGLRQDSTCFSMDLEEPAQGLRLLYCWEKGSRRIRRDAAALVREEDTPPGTFALTDIELGGLRGYALYARSPALQWCEMRFPCGHDRDFTITLSVHGQPIEAALALPAIQAALARLSAEADGTK